MHRTAVLALVAATLTGAAVPASAAPIVESGHYIETVGAMCTNLASCSVVFAAVPTNKYLAVASVSCQTSMSTPSVILRASVVSRRGGSQIGAGVSYLRPFSIGVAGGIRTYAMHEQVRHIVLGKNAGSEGGAAETVNQKPEVIFARSATTGAFNATCTIVGVLKNAV